MLALYIIGGLLVLLVAVLSIPVDVRVRVFCCENPGAVVSVGWLFGLLRIRIVPGKERKKPKRNKSREKPGKKGRGPRFTTVVKVLRTGGLTGEVKRLVKAVIRRIHIMDLVADVGIGLDDPADTGMLFAVIGPAAAGLRYSGVTGITLVPLPYVAAVQGWLGGTVRLWPVSFIPPLARFVVSIPVLTAMKIFITETWKNRHRA